MTGRSTRLYQHGNPFCLGRCRDENTCAEYDKAREQVRRDEAMVGTTEARREAPRFTFGDDE